MSTDEAGDRARWVNAVLERFEGPLTLYASRLLGDVHAARDVVQETFLRLCREPRGTVEAHLAPWLYTVCRNLATDERRKGRHMARTNAPTLDGRQATGAPPDAAVERTESATKALEAIDALPESQQEVLRLKFRHGLSYREIAGVTGLTVSHVGVLIHEGMKSLRRHLGVPMPVKTAIEGGVQ